tara:strand:+ start:1130 stop:1354 length:225 start_codon:yes stop_codon:yes gene_type:complete
LKDVKKKYLVPIWGEVRFHIEVDAIDERDAVTVAYSRQKEFYSLMKVDDEIDVFWDYDRTSYGIDSGDIEEVDE